MTKRDFDKATKRNFWREIQAKLNTNDFVDLGSDVVNASNYRRMRDFWVGAEAVEYKAARPRARGVDYIATRAGEMRRIRRNAYPWEATVATLHRSMIFRNWAANRALTGRSLFAVPACWQA